jgi:N-acetylmuramoyl-L-alanine amidase
MTQNKKMANTPKFGLLRQVFIIMGVGLVLATLFTAWTPTGIVADSLSGKLLQENEIAALATPNNEIPTPTPRPRPRIGIVAGHWGNDTGAICDDGLTEEQINLTVATLTKQNLVNAGFDVDLLEEFDERLDGYRALALVSIHADSCEYINDLATGFKVASALSTTNTERANRLTSCLKARYQTRTSMSYHSTSITPDMTSYHAFGEIDRETTAAIIETGFMNLDRQILTQAPELIAQGIAEGVLCFIRNENIILPTETAP